MPPTMGKTLREHFDSPFAGSRVDRAAGVVRDVLVCGTESANGRRYPWGRGLTCDPRKYEGRPVNADHGRESSISRRIGWLENVRVGGDGRPRADLHILKSHPSADAVFEAAERNPSLFGLSHVAVCRTRMESGVEVIESVETVQSVDLVADPATTKGLYESTQHMPTTLRTFLEAVGKTKPAAAKWSRAKWVREMDEMPLDMPMPVEDMTEPVEGDDGIQAAFKTAMNAVLDSAMSMGGDVPDADVVKKIKKLLAAKGDINGDGKVDEADVDAADDDMPDAETYESKGFERGKTVVMEAVQTVTKFGLPVTPETLVLATKLPASDFAAAVKVLAEAKTPAAETKPRTSGRQTTVTESKQPDSKPTITVDAVVKAFK